MKNRIKRIGILLLLSVLFGLMPGTAVFANSDGNGNSITLPETEIGMKVGGTYQMKPKVTTATGTAENRRTRGIIYEDGECRYDLGNYSTGSWAMKDFCGYVTDDLRMFSSYYVYCDACQNYIGTICNLEEPVTKTDSQSLKITYSITDA